MRIGGSLLLIALGAVLRFAVTTQHTHGVDLWAVGVILMVIGAIGLVLTAIFMTTRRRTDVIQTGAPVVGEPVVGAPVVGRPVTTRTTYVTPNDPTAPY